MEVKIKQYEFYTNWEVNFVKNAKKYLLEIGKGIIVYIFSAIYIYYNVDTDKPFVLTAVLFLLSIIFVHIIIHYEENKKK